MVSYETLLVDRPKAGIVVATLNRPDRLNALTFGMFDDLARLAADVGADDRVRVLVLTGTQDMVEAFTAFGEKRPPVYTGR